MGVIDLNARVTALEKNGAGGAELDQIEADLTALEETVNGNGETDLGLVGDVAALENMFEDVSDKITVNSGITVNGTPVIKAVKISNVVFACITVDVKTGSQPAGTEYTLLDIDSSITPAATVSSYCSGASGATSRANASSVSSTILVNGGNYARFNIFWFVETT